MRTELVPPSTSNGKRKGNRSRSRPMGKAAAKKPRQAQSSTIEVAPAVARDEEVSGWVNADPLQATQRSFHFRGNCGSKLNNLDGTSEALEFFFALLDEEVQDDLIKEINAYAEVQIQKNTPLTKHSRYHSLVAQLEKKAAGITPVAIATAASHRTKHANVANAVERFQGNKHLVDYDGADV
ncbi:hypothetical protein RRG08_036870, partial [Elysia crispata]